jgi:hypothetical protein
MYKNCALFKKAWVYSSFFRGSAQIHRVIRLDSGEVSRAEMGRKVGIMVRDLAMANQPRVVKVLAALLLAMTTGAGLLMALGNNPPSAGPFCLSSYYRLDPIEQAVGSRASQFPNRWDCIEVYYSGTSAGNVRDLTELEGPPSADLNCHFVLCNGHGGGNGQIETTDRWQKQWSVVPDRTWFGTSRTIRICVIADARATWPTDYQIKRLEMLVGALCRKFHVPPKSIYYPRDCQ